MKKLYLLFLPCLLLTLSALSQKKEKPEEYPFMMKDITYLSDSTGAAILEYGDLKKAGLAFVNDKGLILKELNIPGKVLGIARRKGNALVFYVNQWDKEVDETTDVHVVLADATSKTIAAPSAQTFYIQGLPMLQQTRHRIFFLGEERKGPAAGQ